MSAQAATEIAASSRPPAAATAGGSAAVSGADAVVVAALILFGAVAPLLPTNELKTDATVLAGVVLGAGAYLRGRSGAARAGSILDRPILLLLAVAILSTIFSVDRFVSFFPSTRRGEGLVVFAVYLLMALGAARLSVRGAALVIGTALGSGTLIGLIAVAQYYGVDPAAWAGFEPVTQAQFYGAAGAPPGSGPLYGVRSHATLANPVFLGGYVVLLLPLAVQRVLTAPRRWWLPLIAVAALYGALIASQTRAAWIAAAIAGLVLIGRTRGTAPARRRLTVLALVAVCVTVTMPLTQPKAALSRRAASTLNPGDAALAERIYLWKNTLPLIAQRPVLGWGFSTLLGRFPDLGSADYVRVYGWHAVGIDTPHNELLHMAYSIGLIGLAAYLWIWARVIRTLLRARPHEEAVPSLPAALLAALAGYLFWLQLAWNHIGPAQAFWTLVGLAAAAGGSRAAAPPTQTRVA